MNLEAVQAALCKLRSAYTQETVEVWVQIRPGGAFDFTARIGEHGDKLLEPVYGWGATPDVAAQMAIDKAGDRNPRAIKLRKIEELQEQIRKIEMELLPAPEALAQLVGECEKPVMES